MNTNNTYKSNKDPISLEVRESKQIFNRNGSKVTNAPTIGTSDKSARKRVARKSYKFIKSDGQIIGIKCLICEITSYGENDIRDKYCGRCHINHNQTAKSCKSTSKREISVKTDNLKKDTGIDVNSTKSNPTTPGVKPDMDELARLWVEMVLQQIHKAPVVFSEKSSYN